MNWKLTILIGLGMFIIVAGFFLVGGEVGGVNLETITAKVITMSGSYALGDGVELDTGNTIPEKNVTEYPPSLTAEQSYYGYLVKNQEGNIGKTKEVVDKIWHPDGDYSGDLYIETEINNISIRGYAKVSRYFTGTFYINTSKDTIFEFQGKTKIPLTLTYSTNYVMDKEVLDMGNETINLPVKKFSNYQPLTKLQIQTIRTSTLNNKEFFIDPTISACGTISSVGSYTLNQSISSTTNCIQISVSNVSLDCAGNTITFNTGGAGGYGVFSTTVGIANVTVQNCNIQDGNFSGGNTVRGISIAPAIASTLSSGYKFLNNIINITGTITAYGIYGTSTNTQAIPNHLYYNNTIYILAVGTGAGIGLHNLNPKYVNCSNNNIYIQDGNIAIGIDTYTGWITNNNRVTTNCTGAVTCTGIRFELLTGAEFTNSTNDKVTQINKGNWIDVLNAVSGTAVTNITFNNSFGSINFPNAIILSSSRAVTNNSLLINSNLSYVNATLLTEFNTTSTVTLNGLTLTGTPTIGQNTTDTITPIGFSTCSGCSLTSYAGGVGLFTVPNWGFSYALKNCWTKTGSGTGSVLSIPTGCLYQVNTGVAG